MHALIDYNTDKYFPLLDHWEIEIERLETEIMSGKKTEVIHDIMAFKRTINHLKKSLTPQREMINKLARKDSEFISMKNTFYFKDLFDHMIRIESILESFRETLTSLFEAFLTINSNKMNEAQLKLNKTMQHLTIISTIFLPLTFVAGIYGMNFHFIPEIHTEFGEKYGYFMVLGFMALIGIGMLVYFKKKKWI